MAALAAGLPSQPWVISGGRGGSLVVTWCGWLPLALHDLLIVGAYDPVCRHRRSGAGRLRRRPALDRMAELIGGMAPATHLMVIVVSPANCCHVDYIGLPSRPAVPGDHIAGVG